MSFDLTLQPVHALSVPTRRTTRNSLGEQTSTPGPAKLRVVELMQLQQALHNAHLPDQHDHVILIRQVIGRSVTALSEVRRDELRPVLRHLRLLADRTRL